MGLRITKLTPVFGAEIHDVDISRPLDEETGREILDAFDEYSVLLFRGQDIDDAKQIAFSKLFGPLETTLSANPAGGTVFARQSNLDIETGEPIPIEDRRMIYQRANMLWHSDSSFKPTPSLCSILTARIVPAEGGATELASTRAAYAALPAERKAELEGLIAEHCLLYSRDRVAQDILTESQKAEVPPVRQRVVRTNPRNGRKSLLIGAHTGGIVGWPKEKGAKLLDDLVEFATQPQFRYRHEWREGDVIVWDNRACLHRATPFDAKRYKRLMQRTTIAGSPETVGAGVAE